LSNRNSYTQNLICQNTILKYLPLGTLLKSEFDSRPPQLVLTGDGWLSISLSHLGQLSLLFYVGRETSSGQSAVMLCGWVVKAGWLIAYVNKSVGGR